MNKPLKLTSILKKVRSESEQNDIVLGDVLLALEYRGYGPLVLAAALLTVLPTGAIPGVPTLTGILVAYITVQMLLGFRHPWLPNVLMQRKISRETFDKAANKFGFATRQIDKLITPRLGYLFNGLTIRLVAIVCFVLALTMPPLEVVPFLAFLPAVAISCFGLSLSAQDGLLLLLGFLITAISFVAAIYSIG